MYKKLLIASAATLLASSAFAQSSVTLYGLIDEAVRYETHAAGLSATGVVGADGSAVKLSDGAFNGTRFGMRGVEDLGNGLKAVFALESGFGLGDGKSQQGGRLFGRQAFVGLSTNAGTVTLGRQYTPTFNFAGDFDPIGISNLGETAPELAYAQFRQDNSINYAANFSGFNVQAMYGFGGVAGSNRQNSLMGIRAGYTIAGVGIGGVYQQLNNNGGAAAVPGIFSGTADVKNGGVGLSYAFGPVKVMGNWLNTRNVNGISGLKSNLYTLGVNYLATPQVNLIGAGYYDKLSAAGISTSRYTLMGGAQYLLSKRTTAYLTVDYTKEKDNNYSGLPVSLNNGIGNRTNVMVGVRHAF